MDYLDWGGTPVAKAVEVNIPDRQANNADEEEGLHYVCIS
jgi:hypothetical protein